MNITTVKFCLPRQQQDLTKTCGSRFFCNITLICTNKYLVSQKFRFPIFLTFCHMSLSCIMVRAWPYHPKITQHSSGLTYFTKMHRSILAQTLIVYVTCDVHLDLRVHCQVSMLTVLWSAISSHASSLKHLMATLPPHPAGTLLHLGGS